MPGASIEYCPSELVVAAGGFGHAGLNVDQNHACPRLMVCCCLVRHCAGDWSGLRKSCRQSSRARAKGKETFRNFLISSTTPVNCVVS